MADDALKDLPTALIENYVLLNAALEQQNTGKFESMLSYQEKLHDNIQRIMQGLEVAPSLAVVMPGSAQQPDGSGAAPAVRWLLSPPLLPPTPASAMAPPAAPPPPAAAAATAAAAAAGAGASIGTGGATPPAMHAAHQPQQQAPDAFHTAAGGLAPSPYTMAALAGAAPDQRQQQQQVEEDSLQLHQQHRRSSGTGSHASGVGPGPGANADRLPGMMGHVATLTSSAAAAPAANPQLMQLQGYALQQQQQAWQGPALAAGGAGGVVAQNQAMQQLPGTSVFGTSQPGPPGLSLGGTPVLGPGAMLGGAPHSSDWLAVVNTSVAGFLQLLGLERFEPLLQENGVDMAALQLMTEQHLKDLGLPIGAVVKIRAALARPGV